MMKTVRFLLAHPLLSIDSVYTGCAGFLVDYISHPVINSFTTAAAITIAASQLKASSATHTFHNIQANVICKLPSKYRRFIGLVMFTFIVALC